MMKGVIHSLYVSSAVSVASHVREDLDSRVRNPGSSKEGLMVGA